MIETIISMMKNYPIIALGSFSPLIPILLALKNWKYLSKGSKVLFYFLIFYVISDIPLWITAALKINNLTYSYLRDTLVVIGLASLFLIRLKNKKAKNVLFLIISVIILNFIIQIIFLENSGNFLWISRLLLIFISFGYFSIIIREIRIKNILTYPFFWYNSGFIIFGMSSLMIMFFHKFTLNANVENSKYHFFNNILEIISISLFLFISVGLIVAKQNYKFVKK